MNPRQNRAPWAALLVGVAIALVLGVWRPGAWRWGSTPRFVATAVLVGVVTLALRLRWGRGRSPGSLLAERTDERNRRSSRP